MQLTSLVQRMGCVRLPATRAAENGATVSELEAIFGWHGGRMASHYTKEANRVRLAREAMHKLATSNPSPLDVSPLTSEAAVGKSKA